MCSKQQQNDANSSSRQQGPQALKLNSYYSTQNRHMGEKCSLVTYPFGSRIAQRVGTQGRKGEDRRKGKGDGVKKGREGGDADNAGKSTTGWLGKKG